MITTYNSNCMKCMNGSVHPWHDDGTPAEVIQNDPRFSQLPPEKMDRFESSHRARKRQTVRR